MENSYFEEIFSEYLSKAPLITSQTTVESDTP